jgi:hypothetical protein
MTPASRHVAAGLIGAVADAAAAAEAILGRPAAAITADGAARQSSRDIGRAQSPRSR